MDVEVATLESWDPAGRRFDLLISAQAWHWVDPAAGATKAAEVLASGGRLAAFWNVMHHRPAVLAVLAAVYSRHASDLPATSVALGVDATMVGRAAVAAAALRTAAFGNVSGELTTYRWHAEYTPSAWVGLLRTHSDHATLPPPARDDLLDDLASALSGLGESFTVDFRTALLSAVRI